VFILERPRSEERNPTDMPRTLAEKSVGTPDPGATSLAMCARVVADVLAARGNDDDTDTDRAK